MNEVLSSRDGQEGEKGSQNCYRIKSPSSGDRNQLSRSFYNVTHHFASKTLCQKPMDTVSPSGLCTAWFI